LRYSMQNVTAQSSLRVLTRSVEVLINAFSERLVGSRDLGS